VVLEAKRTARGHRLGEYLIPADAPVAHDIRAGEISDAVDRILSGRRTMIDELEREFLRVLDLTLGSDQDSE
jgi:hypothetical protein